VHFYAAEYRLFNGSELKWGRGSMHNLEGKPGRTAVEAEAAVSHEGVSGHSGPGLPVTEISDKDYRSFCWPCNALEEESDGEPDE
jgi:hypothetical protein